MKSLVLTPASVAWVVLTSLTAISWALGTEHALGGGDHVPASLVIIVVAAFKIRLIGLYFMELRQAPYALRGVFEAYCAVLAVLLSGMYLLV
jgi:hypothetical protein